MNKYNTRIILMIVLCLLLVVGDRTAAFAHPSTGVFPPTTQVQGRSLAEWSTVFWQQAYGIPFPENPIVNPGPECYFYSDRNVGLAIPAFGVGSRSCEIPAGMKLYVTVVGVECSTVEAPPFFGGTPPELRLCAKNFKPANLSATVDGVPVQKLNSYTTLSPLFRFTLPEQNILGLPAGTAKSVALANAFILKPMSPGEHTVTVYGEIPYAGGLTIDWTYNITVVPHP